MSNYSDPLANLLLDAARHDEVIKQAIRKLAWEVVQESHKLLTTGSPSTKMSVIRTLLPSLVRSLEKTEDADTSTQLRDELASLMSEIRSGAKVVLDIQPATAIEQDRPPMTGPRKLTGGNRQQ